MWHVIVICDWLNMGWLFVDCTLRNKLQLIKGVKKWKHVLMRFHIFIYKCCQPNADHFVKMLHSTEIHSLSSKLSFPALRCVCFWTWIIPAKFLPVKSRYRWRLRRLVPVCSKPCLVILSIRSIFRRKNARALQREYTFPSEKSNELTDQQDMFCFNHASAFYTRNDIEKNVDY